MKSSANIAFIVVSLGFAIVLGLMFYPQYGGGEAGHFSILGEGNPAVGHELSADAFILSSAQVSRATGKVKSAEVKRVVTLFAPPSEKSSVSFTYYVHGSDRDALIVIRGDQKRLDYKVAKIMLL